MEISKVIKSGYKLVLAFILISLVAGVLFSLLEGESFFRSIYWALVTMTTVGYGDVVPQTASGKVTSVILASAGIVLYGYAVTIITTIVTKASLSEVFGMNKSEYEDHIIICGWTPESEVALSELLAAEMAVIVITENKDDVPIIKRKSGDGEVSSIYGDPSKEEILKQAGVEKAKVIILSTDDDSKNIITALHVKRMNPEARLIVKTSRSELKETMKIAGVTYVATPHETGGRLIGSAAFEPEVANFVEDITSATDVGGYDLKQYTFTKKEETTAGDFFRRLKEEAGAFMVAVAKRPKDLEAEWEILPNPSDDLKISDGDVVILLGNDQQFEKVEEILDIKQGRCPGKI